MYDAELDAAAGLARRAGSLILEYYAKEIIAEEKLGVDNFYEPVTEADRMASRIIVDGLSERLIFREFYPRGLTAVDDLDEATLGTRPTLSHASAALEMQNLVRRILGLTAAPAGAVANAA